MSAEGAVQGAVEAVADGDIEEVEAPEGAVLVGLWASGARCLLQYVMAPLLGALGFWVPGAGLLVQVLGCAVTVVGVAEVRRSRRPGWPLWLGLAGVVLASTAWALVSAVAQLS